MIEGELSIIVTVVAIIIVFIIFLNFIPINLWITAQFSGVRVELMSLVFMKIRKASPSKIINAAITLAKGGVGYDINKLETAYLSGRNLENITSGLITANLNKYPISFEEAMRLDSLGTDVHKHVVEKVKQAETH